MSKLTDYQNAQIEPDSGLLTNPKPVMVGNVHPVSPQEMLAMDAIMTHPLGDQQTFTAPNLQQALDKGIMPEQGDTPSTLQDKIADTQPFWKNAGNWVLRTLGTAGSQAGSMLFSRNAVTGPIMDLFGVEDTGPVYDEKASEFAGYLVQNASGGFANKLDEWWTNDVNNSMNEMFPNYKRSDDKPWQSRSFYWDFTSMMFTSALGMAIPQAAALGAVGLTGTALRASRIAKLVEMFTGEAVTEFIATNPGVSNIVRDLAASFYMNQMEGNMMGADAYRNIMTSSKAQLDKLWGDLDTEDEQYLNELKARNPDLSDEVLDAIRQERAAAKRAKIAQEVDRVSSVASDFADNFVRWNTLTMATDFIGIHGIMRGVEGYTRYTLRPPAGIFSKGGAQTLASDFKQGFTSESMSGKPRLDKLAILADNPAVQGLKEAGEEEFQNTFQSVAQHRARKALGDESNYDRPEETGEVQASLVPTDLFGQILHYMFVSTNTMQAVSALFGGAPQRMFTKAFTGQYFTIGKQQKAYDLQQQAKSEIEQFGKVSFKTAQQFEELRKKAATSTNPEEAINAVNAAQATVMAVKAFKTGTTQNLINLYDKIINGSYSEAEIKENGWGSNYKETARKMKDDLLQMEKDWVQTTRTNSNGEQLFDLKQAVKVFKQADKDIDVDYQKKYSTLLSTVKEHVSNMSNGETKDKLQEALGEVDIRGLEHEKYSSTAELLDGIGEVSSVEDGNIRRMNSDLLDDLDNIRANILNVKNSRDVAESRYADAKTFSFQRNMKKIAQIRNRALRMQDRQSVNKQIDKLNKYIDGINKKTDNLKDLYSQIQEQSVADLKSYQNDLAYETKSSNAEARKQRIAEQQKAKQAAKEAQKKNKGKVVNPTETEATNPVRVTKESAYEKVQPITSIVDEVADNLIMQAMTPDPNAQQSVTPTADPVEQANVDEAQTLKGLGAIGVVNSDEPSPTGDSAVSTNDEVANQVKQVVSNILVRNETAGKEVSLSSLISFLETVIGEDEVKRLFPLIRDSYKQVVKDDKVKMLKNKTADTDRVDSYVDATYSDVMAQTEDEQQEAVSDELISKQLLESQGQPSFDGQESVVEDLENIKDFMAGSASVPSDISVKERAFEWIKTTSAYNAFAYVSRKYKQLMRDNVFTREEVYNKLNSENFNYTLLDIKKVVKGTKIRLVSKADSYDQKIYVPYSDMKEETTWGEYKAKLDTDLAAKRIDQRAYDAAIIENVPISIQLMNGEHLAYVHATSWIKLENVAAESDNALINEKLKNRAIRKYVLDNGGTFETEVAERVPGPLFITVNNEMKLMVGSSLEDSAMPDKNLKIGVCTKLGTLSVGVDKTFEWQLVRSDTMKIGFTYAITPIAYDPDTKTTVYLPVPVANTRLGETQLGEDVVRTVIFAMKCHLIGAKRIEQAGKNYAVFAKQVKEKTDLDILTHNGIDRYLKIFLNSYDLKEATVLFKDQYSKASDISYLGIGGAGEHMSSTTPFIHINGGNIEYCYGKGENHRFISRNAISHISSTQKLNELFDNFANFLLGNYGGEKVPPRAVYQHTNLEHLEKNTNIVYVKEDGSIATTNYASFIRNSLQTNVLSFNIGSPEKPNYVYSIQPTITFDTSVIDGELGITQKAQEKEAEQPVAVQEGKMPEKIATTFGDINLEDASVAVMQEENVENIRKTSSKFLIPGLEADRQNTIVAYLRRALFKKMVDYERIGTNVKVDEEFANQKNLFIAALRVTTKEEREAEEIPMSIRDQLNRAVELKDDRAIEILRGVVASLETVVNNWKAIERLTKISISQLQGVKIKIDATVVAKGTDEVSLIDATSQEDIVNKENSNWDDLNILTFDAKETIGLKAKKRLCEIPMYNSDRKTIKRNFFGAEESMDFDEVYAVLQKQLSSTAPDIALMATILESQININPWYKDIIAILKGTDRQLANQLVYNLTGFHAMTHFILWDTRQDGSYYFSNYTANAHEISTAIRAAWKRNLLNKDYIVPIGRENAISEGTRKSLVREYNSWVQEHKKSKTLPTKGQIDGWLSRIGIELSDGALNAIVDRKFFIKGRSISLLDNLTAKAGPIYQLAANLQSNATGTIEEGKFMEQRFIFDLAKLESVYSRRVYSNSYLSGGKMMQSYIKSQASTVRLRDLQTLTQSYTKEPNPETEAGLPAGYRKLEDSEILDEKYPYTRDYAKKLPGAKEAEIFTITKAPRHIQTSKIMTDLYDNSAFVRESTWLQDMLIFQDKVDSKGVTYREVERGENGYVRVNTNSTTFNNLTLGNIDITAMKRANSKRTPKQIHEFSDIELEVFKLAQIASKYERPNMTKSLDRIICLLYPTTSDKTRVVSVNCKSFDFTIDDHGNFSKKTIHALYKAIVLPEINRIRNQQAKRRNNTRPNLAGYNAMAEKFIYFPQINNIKGIFDVDGSLHEDIYTQEWTDKIEREVYKYATFLVNQKMRLWTDMGIGIGTKSKDDSGNPNLSDMYVLINSTYMSAIENSLTDKTKKYAVRYAAMDMVTQYLVGLTNINQLFTGDPAMFEKDETTKTSEKVKTRLVTEELAKRAAKGEVITETVKKSVKEDYDSLDQHILYLSYTDDERIKEVEDLATNMGKRLAADIAPKSELPIDPFNTTMKTLVVKDHVVQSSIYPELKTLLDKYSIDSKSYKRINVTDGQEFITWKEHLDIMYSQGYLSDEEYKTISTKFIAQENLLFAGKAIPESMFLTGNDLSRVFQPIKPVTSGNYLRDGLDVRIYIKSSRMPLLPQIVQGTDIAPVLSFMKKNDVSVLSFESAVKTGGVRNPVKLFDENGKFVEPTAIDVVKQARLEIPRSLLGIQQEIPFDELKDHINRVTQASKNLFTNILDVDNFVYRDNKYKGYQLKEIYDDLYGKLFEYQRKELVKELHPNGVIDYQKVREILEDEAVKRNYPLAELEAFGLDDFLHSLAFTPSAERFEALLCSIVSNRVLKIPMRGFSAITISELGSGKTVVKAGEDLTAAEKSGIVYTNSNDTAVTPQRYIKDENGNTTGVEPAHIIVSWKFKQSINDFIDRSTGLLDMSRIPKEMFDTFLMRIPNQGLNSHIYAKIIGFVPANVSGDIVIGSRDFVTQTGMDFDIDKLYGYTYNTKYDEATKSIIVESDMKTFEGMQNALYDVHKAVLSNPSEDVQAQIKTPLETLDLEEIANEIDSYRKIRSENTVDTETNTKQRNYFTILSDQYQKDKFLGGTMGKSGVAIFSTDNIFNSLAQRHEESKDELQMQVVSKKTGKRVDLSVRFGNKESNGKLSGRKGKTIDGEHFISSVIAAYQSASVDNEKLQIIGKINVNNATFQVVKILNQLGFYRETPYLLSQDIIIDYVKELNNQSSGLLGYTANPEGEAKSIVLAKKQYALTADEQAILLDPMKYKEFAEDKASLETMKALIKDGPAAADYRLMQSVLLDKFLELKTLGETLQSLQTAINIDASGFGKSLIESNLRYENAVDVLKDKHNIKNEWSLLGKKIYKDELATLPITEADKYMPVDADRKWFFKSTTLNGHAIFTALRYNNSLWGEFFPYKTKAVQDAFEEAEQYLGGNRIKNVSSRAEFRRTVWESMRAYQYSNVKLGLIEDGTAITMSQERYRLFYNSSSDNSKFVYVNFQNDQDRAQILNGSKTTLTLPNESGKAINNRIGDSGLVELGSKMFRLYNRGYLTYDETKAAYGKDFDSKFGYLKDATKSSEEEQKWFNEGTHRRHIYDVKEDTSVTLNKSIARVAFELSKDKRFAKKPFIQLLEFNLPVDGFPSFTQINAASKENSNDNEIYSGFIDLITNSKPTGIFSNGKEYTTREIAQELILAMYASGGIQEAIQYTRYIPIQYLNEMKFLKNLIGLSWNDVEAMFKMPNKTEGIHYPGSQLLTQMAQHYPEFISFTLDKDLNGINKLAGNTVGTLTEFTIKEETLAAKGLTKTPPLFVTIPNNKVPKGIKKFAIFKLYEDGIYRRLDNLGVFGLMEFDCNYDSLTELKSIVNGNQPTLPVTSQTPVDVTETQPKTTKALPPASAVSEAAKSYTPAPFGMVTNVETGRETLKSVLASIATTSGKASHKFLASMFLKKINLVDKNIQFIVDPTISTSGLYSRKSNSLTFNPIYSNGEAKSSDMIAQDILHEMVHVFTSNKLEDYERYINDETNSLTLEDVGLTQKEHDIIKEIYNLFTSLQKKAVATPEKRAEFDAAMQAFANSKQVGAVTTVTTNMRSKYYGLSSFKEFAAEVISDEGFQRRLNEVSGDNWSQKFITKIKELFAAVLGIEVKKGSALDIALNDVLGIIDSTITIEEVKEVKSVEQQIAATGVTTNTRLLSPNSKDLSIGNLVEHRGNVYAIQDKVVQGGKTALRLMSLKNTDLVDVAVPVTQLMNTQSEVALFDGDKYLLVNNGKSLDIYNLSKHTKLTSSSPLYKTVKNYGLLTLLDSNKPIDQQPNSVIKEEAAKTIEENFKNPIKALGIVPDGDKVEAEAKKEAGEQLDLFSVPTIEEVRDRIKQCK